MHYQHRSDPNESSVAGRVLVGVVPALPITEGLTRCADRSPHFEDMAIRKSREQLFRNDPTMLQEMFEGPKLSIVGRNADCTIARISIRQIVADRRSPRRTLPFAGVPERVSDRQAEQHPLNTVERHVCVRGWGAKHGQRT